MSPTLATFTNRCLIFTNPGEIDPRLISVLGTNVKDSASAIGQFGTGLKYAVAGVLRLGGDITIFTGPRRITFTTNPNTIRGKSFTFITMHITEYGCGSLISSTSQELGFTLDFGKHWQPWMIYRELYCNAKDEGGTVSIGAPAVVGAQDKTTIVVQCSELHTVHNSAHQWFLPSSVKPLTTTAGVEIYIRRNDSSYFYRGIKVGEFSCPSLFTYNIIEETSLTEDRTMPEYLANPRIAASIYKSETIAVDVLRTVVASVETLDHIERRFNWPGPWVTPSHILLDVLTEARKTKRAFISANLLLSCVEHLPKEPPVTITLTPVQAKMLSRAKDLLAAIDINITVPIIVVESLGSGFIMGAAADGVIYLPLNVFEKGTKYVASTLLEEHAHTKYGFDDASRDFQTWLCDKVISLGEIIRGEPV